MIQKNYFIFKNILNIIKKCLVNDHLVQEIYFKECEKIELNKIECPCCHHKCSFKVKGYYKRHIIICGTKFLINVKRIVCKECNRSHALFFNDLIPYTSLSSIDYEYLVLNNFKSDMYSFDYLYYLKLRVMKFGLRLKPILLKIMDNIELINSKYIPYRHNSYMQIHKGFVST